jgi:GNAT superfamily N-acetyltransferase
MARPTYASKVELDEVTRGAAAAFDYGSDSQGTHVQFDGTRTFLGWEKPSLPSGFAIGLIVGPSGSGKTLLLRQFGEEEIPVWNPNKAVASASHFTDVADLTRRLGAVGLNSVPSWCSPYQVLSNGEKFRADCARKLKDGAVIDEFTSVVDRTVAKSISVALRRYADNGGVQNLVLASCHYDILPWLMPDWYFDTVDGLLHDRGSLRRPDIFLRVYPCQRSIWRLFAAHHYYSQEIAQSSRTFLATAEFDGYEELVGFIASLPMPSGTLKNAWRASRTVVLPDFQGLGIGPRISDMVADIHRNEGKRYYSKTTSDRLGGWRNSPHWCDLCGRLHTLWVGTSKAGIKGGKRLYVRPDSLTAINTYGGKRREGYYSHEFIGCADGDEWASS